MKYLLALDQGTTSSRAILFDESGKSVSMAQFNLQQSYPADGWVEQDAQMLFATQLHAAVDAVEKAKVNKKDIRAIGITNQRETTVVWEKRTGRAICPAIVWQCRRGAPYCEAVKKDDALCEYIRTRTGLSPDPYFSASKIAWILDHVEGAREAAQSGDLLFGTVESYLLFMLTAGRVHASDSTNASRTMLFDIQKGVWDGKLLDTFRIPAGMLPRVYESMHLFGTVDEIVSETLGGIPIYAMAGDQQAALFGDNCLTQGDAKCTYGTGGFLLLNTGGTMVRSRHGLLTTIALQKGKQISYALEGSVFHAGSAVKWLRDDLRLIETAQECDALAESVADSAGAVFVPAFTGLGAPYWDAYARGALLGLTRACTKAHVARAVLEGIAFQVYDVLCAMQEDVGTALPALRVSGGVSNSDVMLQFQADLLELSVLRSSITEASAKGVAAMAGLACGLWEKPEDFLKTDLCKFSPKMDEDTRQNRLELWKKAVQCTLAWGGHRAPVSSL